MTFSAEFRELALNVTRAAQDGAPAFVARFRPDAYDATQAFEALRRPGLKFQEVTMSIPLVDLVSKDIAAFPGPGSYTLPPAINTNFDVKTNRFRRTRGGYMPLRHRVGHPRTRPSEEELEQKAELYAARLCGRTPEALAQIRQFLGLWQGVQAVLQLCQLRVVLLDVQQRELLSVRSLHDVLPMCADHGEVSMVETDVVTVPGPMSSSRLAAACGNHNHSAAQCGTSIKAFPVASPPIGSRYGSPFVRPPPQTPRRGKRRGA